MVHETTVICNHTNPKKTVDVGVKLPSSDQAAMGEGIGKYLSRWEQENDPWGKEKSRHPFQANYLIYGTRLYVLRTLPPIPNKAHTYTYITQYKSIYKVVSK